MTDFPAVDVAALAWIDTDQMREIDRIMIEDLHIELLQMMENAGRALASVVRGTSVPATVAVYAGRGGNGGGGLVAARHLANAGIDVTVVLSHDDADMSAAAAHQLDVAQRMGLAVVTDPVHADVAVDALVGYGLTGQLRGATQRLALAMQSTSAAVVSLDAPTGLDTSTGVAAADAVHADATVTLCLPKVGLADADEVGELFWGWGPSSARRTDGKQTRTHRVSRDVSMSPQHVIGEGDLVPDLALVDHEGARWRFSEHRGRFLVVVLHRHLA